LAADAANWKSSPAIEELPVGQLSPVTTWLPWL
jgi:hypothetical protein